MSKIRIATCTCNGLKLECEGEPTLVSVCSCLDCQRRTGSAFGIAAFYPRGKVKIFGSQSRYRRTSEQGHEFSFFFCPDCGNTVYWETTRKAESIVVAGGSFADPEFPPPSRAAFEEHRQPWISFSL
jgi:hypothetical protein